MQSTFQRLTGRKHGIRLRTASIILALRHELKRYASPRLVHFALVNTGEQEAFFITIFTVKNHFHVLFFATMVA